MLVRNIRNRKRTPLTPLFMGAESCEKVKVCKLFSQLSSCTLFMGAKSCAKSLEIFTFDNNRAIFPSKSLQTFCVANVAEESCTAEIISVRERRSPRQSREGGPTRGLSTWNRRGDSGYGSSKIYRGLLPPWRRTGAYCAQHSAVLLLVLVLLGCECQTEQFP